ASCLARAQLVELQYVAALDLQHLADGAVHGGSEFTMSPKLAILAVNRNEVAGFNQVNDELEFFLAGMPTHVHWRRRAIFVNHMRLAAKHVVNHAVDRLLVARDDAGGEHHRVPWLDAGVLVVIDRSARESRHGLALRATDEYTHPLRSM